MNQPLTCVQMKPFVPSQMIKVEDQSLIIFICQDNFIALYDEKTNKIKIFNVNEQVQYIMLIDNQQYLISGMITYASIYLIQHDNIGNFSLQQKQTFSIVDITIVWMVYLPNQQNIFILCVEGVLLVYNYIGSGQLSYSSRFSFDNQSFLAGQVSKDERFLFICLDPYDISIYQIETKVSANNATEVTNLIYLLDLQSSYFIVQLALLQIEVFYIYYLDPWLGLYFADLSPLYSNDTQAIQNINAVLFGLGNVNISPTTMCMTISSDEKYLYLGVRSQGILIFDIYDVSNPVWYYQLFVQGQAYYLLLSNNENTLYYSNSNGLYQYQITNLSLTNNIPNLYNSHKSKSLFDGPPFYKWRCQISQQSSVLYAAFDVDMLQRFQIIQNNQIKGDITLQKIDTLPYAKEIITSTPYIDTICLDNKEENLYIPVTDQNNIILKYKIPSSNNVSDSLQFSQSAQYSNIQFAETMKISQDDKYLVLAYTIGVMIVDAVKLEVLSLLTIKDMQKNCFGVDFTRDTNYIFATARNAGIWIIDAQDKKNPFIIQVLKTKAAEAVTSSKLYDIMYCLDGFNGLLIYDTSTMPNLKKLGILKLQGWVNDITFLKDENFAIISTMDLGMISLINLTDKSNPFIVSQFQIGQQNSQTTCVDPTMQYLFILNQYSIRYFSLKSDILIHYEFSFKQINQNSNFVLNNEDFLQVGQTYELRLIPLYQQPNQLINNIFIYQSQKKQNLPIWINLINKLYLEMTIPKEALNFSDNQTITLLVQTQFYLNNSSFVYNSTSFAVSPDLSYRIYLYLKMSGFLDNQDLVTDLYNPENTLTFNDFGSDLPDPNQQILALQMVRNILQNSVDYNPIQFKVQSSLYYILDQINKSFQIHTIFNSVTLQLSFNSSSSLIFVQKEYTNVISYRDDQNTTLNLQSSIESINNILRQNIIYHVSNNDQNSNNTNHYVNLLIQDNFNRDINVQFNVSDLNFLTLKQDIKQLKDLQSQIQKISSDSSFAIESTFFIQLDTNSFLDPDGIPLSYSLLMYQNNNYSNILPEYFLKFDEQNLRLTGTPSASNLFEILHLRLVVSNGYNQLYSDFYIKIYNISLTYILNQLLKYIGPFAFLLGIYRYKSYFINIILRNKSFYSQELAQINKLYRKKITLIGNELIIAELFFNKFQSKNISKMMLKLEKDNFQNQNDIVSFAQLDQESVSQKPCISNRNTFFTTQGQQNTTQFGLKQFNINSQCLDQKTDQEKTSRNKQISTISRNTSLTKQKTMSVYKQKRITNQLFLNRKNAQDISTSLTSVKPKNFSFLKKATKKLSEQEEKIVQIVKKNLEETKRKNFLDKDLIFNLCYSHPNIVNSFLLSSNQKINYSCFNDDKIFDIKITADKLFLKMLQSDIKIKFKGKCQKISDYSKEYHNQHSRFSYCLNAKVVDYLLQLDARTNIVYTYLKDYSKSQMNFTDNDWYKAFVQIEPTNELDCHGIPIPFSNVVVNESSVLNCLSHLDLYSKYERLPISKYQSLPSWIQFDCKNGVIILEGIPSHSDQEEILIRVYNVQNYIMMQYILKIMDEQSGEQQLEQNIPQFCAINQTDFVNESPVKITNYSQYGNNPDYVLSTTHNNKSQKIQKGQIMFCKQNNIEDSLSQNGSPYYKPVDPFIQQSIDQSLKDSQEFLNKFQNFQKQQNIASGFSQYVSNQALNLNQPQFKNNQIKQIIKNQLQKKSISLIDLPNIFVQRDQDSSQSLEIDQSEENNIQTNENKFNIKLNSTSILPNPFHQFKNK
ncbi:hypothetical protein ABPG73_007084 [Tetrahymena malaccensis]